MAKRLVKNSPVGIVLEPTDDHEPIVAKQAEPSVTVRGAVGELVMFVYGRQAHSKRRAVRRRRVGRRGQRRQLRDLTGPPMADS